MGDVTCSDFTPLPPGTRFVKSFVLQNASSQVVWKKGRTLVNVDEFLNSDSTPKEAFRFSEAEIQASGGRLRNKIKVGASVIKQRCAINDLSNQGLHYDNRCVTIPYDVHPGQSVQFNLPLTIPANIFDAQTLRRKALKSTWKLFDEEGNNLFPALSGAFALVVAEESYSGAVDPLDSFEVKFIAPDDAPIYSRASSPSQKSEFTRTVQITNTGQRTWSNRRLLYLNDKMVGPAYIHAHQSDLVIDSLLPQQTKTFQVTFDASEVPVSSNLVWRFADAQGHWIFGPDKDVLIPVTVISRPQ